MSQIYNYNIVFPKIEVKDTDNPNKKQFILEPLEHGFGTTIGNALRRIALSTLPGGAVRRITIGGVAHEFDSVNGSIDEVTSIILKVKDLKIRIDDSVDEEEVYLEINKDTKGDVLASDIICPTGVEVINKDLVLLTLTEDVEFKMVLEAVKGRGYVLAEQNRGKEKTPNEIYVDSIFTPVEKFSFNVEDTRVGDKTNYDKLTIDIETNGMLTPEEAISHASHIMMEHIGYLSNIEENINKSNVFDEPSFNEIITDDEEDTEDETSIETLDISNRAYNGLKRAGINTIEELIQRSRKEISTLDNIGSKTVDEIEVQLSDLGISFKE